MYLLVIILSFFFLPLGSFTFILKKAKLSGYHEYKEYIDNKKGNIFIDEFANRFNISVNRAKEILNDMNNQRIINGIYLNENIFTLNLEFIYNDDKKIEDVIQEIINTKKIIVCPNCGATIECNEDQEYICEYCDSIIKK